MSDLDMTPAEILEMFGGEVQPAKVDAQELEVAIGLRSIRDQLAEIMEKSRIGTVQLAGRLGISPSAVSRLLGGEGDMKVSTAVLYARALRHRWEFMLMADSSCVPQGNHHARMEASVGIHTPGTTTSGSTHIVNVPGPISDAQARVTAPVEIKEFA